jgi:hypothetical protein
MTPIEAPHCSADLSGCPRLRKVGMRIRLYEMLAAIWRLPFIGRFPLTTSPLASLHRR